MTDVFQTIGLVGKQNSLGCVESLHALRKFLREMNKVVVIERETAGMLENPDEQIADIHHLGELCDLAIVVGGDGMMLQTATALVKQDTPVIGVNRGYMGFLTDLHPTELTNKLGSVLAGEYHEEERFLLHADIARGQQEVAAGLALNDVVLTPAGGIHMNEFEIEADDNLVCRIRADGVIVTTPTGSTAYALSGGGPIMYPTLEVIAIVPMFSHSLTSRPIVLPASTRINIKISKDNNNPAKLTCDGNVPIKVHPGDTIRVGQYPHLLRLIHPLDYNYFDTLRAKLGWGGSPNPR